MDASVIQLDQLTRAFNVGKRNQVVAVDNLTLSVKPQQVYGILGPNGAGKSTTIRMLLGLIRPTGGSISILGQNPNEEPDVLRNVGSLLEGATFYSFLSGWKNLEVIGLSQGNFDEDRARQLIDFVGLTDQIGAKAGTYSTGMKQRLGIVAALLNDPQIVILDEPTNGMDPMGIIEMRKFMRQLATEYDKTVVLTSHLLDEVQMICDHVAIIHQGKLINEGDMTEILNKELIRIEVSNPDQALQLLSDYNPSKIADNQLQIVGSKQSVPQIIEMMVQNNLEIFAIAPYQPTLEEYFLNVIGQSSQSEATN